MPTKLEEKIKVFCEGNILRLYIPRLMGGGEGNIRSKGCVVKGMEHQRQKKGKNNRIREDGGVRSSIPMTRSKKGLEKRGGGSIKCV